MRRRLRDQPPAARLSRCADGHLDQTRRPLLPSYFPARRRRTGETAESAARELLSNQVNEGFWCRCRGIWSIIYFRGNRTIVLPTRNVRAGEYNFQTCHQ